MRSNLILLTFSTLFFSLLGVYLFTCGFLLVRNQLTDTTKENPLHKFVNLTNFTAATPFYPMHNRKVVIMLVDSLKWEFAHFNKSITKKDEKINQNKLVFMHELLTTQPQNSMLMRTYADSPTMTLIKLKSIVSGNLYHIIDFKDNFNSDAMTEDNIIFQTKAAKKKAVFLGDDTWLHLFPTQFDDYHGWDSFDGMDLDTNDNGVLKYLDGNLQAKNWTLLIAHFLGLDHAGHTFGPEHEKIKEKLIVMDGIMRNITKTLDNDTILFVMSDHGMHYTGNHGGNTPDETNATMFVYSKTPFNQFKNDVDLISAGILLNETEYSEDYSILDQIDIAPSLSYALGVPIPYSNLGTIVPNLMCWGGSDPDYTKAKCVQEIVDGSMSNAAQIMQYFEKIQETAQKFTQHEVTLVRKSFEEVVGNWTTISPEVISLVEDGQLSTVGDLVKQTRHFTKLVLKIARLRWNQYNHISMYEGKVMMALCVIAVVSILMTFPVMKKTTILGLTSSDSSEPILDTKLIVTISVLLGGAFLLFILGAQAKEFIGFGMLCWLSYLIVRYHNNVKKQSDSNDTSDLVDQPPKTTILSKFNLDTVNDLVKKHPEKAQLFFCLFSFLYAANAIASWDNFRQQQTRLLLVLIAWYAVPLFKEKNLRLFVTLTFFTVGMFVGDTFILKFFELFGITDTLTPEQMKPLTSLWRSKFTSLVVPLVAFAIIKGKNGLIKYYTKFTLIKITQRLSELLVVLYLAFGGWESNGRTNILIATVIVFLNLIRFGAMVHQYYTKGRPLGMNPFACLMAFTETFMIIAGAYALWLFAFSRWVIKNLVYKWWGSSNNRTAVKLGCVTAVLAYYLFWVAGHREIVDTINVKAGYVFTPKFQLLFTGLCIILNLWGLHIWSYLYLMTKVIRRNDKDGLDLQTTKSDIWKISLTWEVFVLLVFMFASIHCSMYIDDFSVLLHFAGKFVFDLMSTITILVVIALTRFTMIVWNPEDTLIAQ